MISVRVSLILVLFGVLAVGCERFTPAAPTFTVRDSAGVEIVESLAPLLGPDAWTISEEPVLQIGEVEGDDPYLFADIGQRRPAQSKVFTLDDGRIIVCNGMDRTIRFFDETGVFIRQVGGQGEGPGEFGRIYACLRGNGGIVGSEGFRVTLFNQDGILEKEVEIPRIRNQRPYVFGAFDDGSLLLAVRQASSDQEVGIHDVLTDAFVFSSEGVLSDRVLVWKDARQVQSATRGIRQAFSPEGQLISAGRQILYGWPETYEIRVFDERGIPVRRIRRNGPPDPVTEEDRGWWASFETEFDRMRGREPNPAQRRAREENEEMMVFPDDHPFFDRLLVDRAGFLWVRRRHPRYDSSYEYSGVRFPFDLVWDVFDPSGRWITTLTPPNSLQIHDIGEDYILGVWKNEMDVEFVRLYSLDRGS